MTLLEKLKQLLGSDLDNEVDSDAKLEDLIKTETEEVKTETGEETRTDTGEEKVETTVETEVKTDEKETPAEEEKKETSETIKSEKEVITETDEKPAGSEAEKEVSAAEKMDNIFDEGWFENGVFNGDKVKDEVVREAIKTVIDKFIGDNKAEKINRAIEDTLNTEYSLNVSNDTLKKMLDVSNISVGDDGTVIGVKESIEELKKSEPGLFKSKEKESNPLNEGFNPVEKNNNSGGMPKNFAQAFRIMEEIS